MSEPQLCPQCGGQIPEGAPAGLCPKCLMLAGLESRPAADPGTAATQPPPSSASTGFVPPTVEEVAARFPQLEILELLGRGGMGAVYKARQKELDRLVAVKILPPEVSRDPAFAERFTREARAMARLNHPNIVALLEISRTADGLIYFVMEYVDGVNLRQAIQAGQMEPKQALAIVPQICDALQFAHDEGVVHRDIKPENILIDKRGRVKIADFGLAKLLGQEAVDHGLTATQQVMGTLRYMAPEQMEGTKAVDHRADIYSLGVVFYELLTGELPIGRFAPPSKMVEIDVRLDEVVLRALEKKPEQRYQHAIEVKTDMESITGSPVAAPAAASETPPLRPHLGIAPANGPNRVCKIGRISLWLAVGGLVVPILLAVVAAALVRYGPLAEECFGVCIVLLYVLELAALVCGIAGWRTMSGKVAVAVSLIWLVFGGCGGISFYLYFMTSAPRTARTAVAPPIISDQARTIGKKAANAPAMRGVRLGRQVPPTPAEIAHVLSELPKEYTKGLLGDNKQRVKDLDTAIWAIDFDDGPAEFWLKTYETGRKTFPVRLPESEKETWRIPKTKAHILIWIQPSHSVAMSARVQGRQGPFDSASDNPRGTILGIDVDGKSVARIDDNKPYKPDGPFADGVPAPLWFEWPRNDDMPGPDAEFAPEMGPKAIYVTGRKTKREGIDISCQMALMYRRATSAGESPKGTKP